MALDHESYATDVLDTTDVYLTAVRECIAVLPATVLGYGTPAFGRRVDRLDERESVCDELLVDLRQLCGKAGPNVTDVYLHTDDVLELYALIDALPNAAERFAAELQTAGPNVTDTTQQDLASMAALASRATMVLTDVVETFVAGLLASGTAVDPIDDIDLVASLEGRADQVKHGIQRRVFADGPSAHALVVRDLARTLDATLDAAEDAADHLLFLDGARH